MTPRHRQDHRFWQCQPAFDALYLDTARQMGPLAALDHFLGKAGEMTNLSIHGIVLVLLQRPDVIAVANATEWLSIGRELLPNAQPIVVFDGPGIDVLYDMTDTQGQEWDQSDVNTIMLGEYCPALMSHLCRAAARKRIRVCLERDPRAGCQGTVRRLEGDSDRWLVCINPDLDDAERYGCLTHELGHVFCGHVGPDPEGAWVAREELEPAIREIEAETASWLVCHRGGVRDDTAAYVSAHLPHADLAAVSLFAIFNAANRMELDARAETGQ